MTEIRRKRLLHQCFLRGKGAVFPVRVEAERGCAPTEVATAWREFLPGRAETISTSSGPAQQKTSDTTEPERQALFKTFTVESERLKSGLAYGGGIS